MNPTRFVVARRWTGLGDCIVSLLAAHAYARATGRTLAVDWRHSPYARAGGDLFPQVFRAPARWDGVPTAALDRVRASAAGATFWPRIWSAEALDRPPVDGERGDAAEAVATIRAGRDVDGTIVVFDNCLTAAAPAPAIARARLARLRVRPDAVAAADAFARDRLDGRPLVAMHVRQGNGGDIMDHARYWTRPGAALVRLADAARAAVLDLRAARGREPALFLATDSAAIESVLARLLPGLLVRPKAYRPAGAGELHHGPDAADGLVDALADMLLLARADLLLRYPPGSMFSYWAAAMKRRAPPGARTVQVPAGLEPAVV